MNSCLNGALLKWRAGEYLREILLGDEDIAALVNEHIYPIIAPENTVGAFIVYNRVKYTRDYSKFGLTEDVARIDVTIISEDYDQTLDLAELVDAVLSGTHNSEDGLKLTFKLHDSQEGFEDFKYFQTLTFDVE